MHTLRDAEPGVEFAIHGDLHVGQVLAWYPQTLDVFDRHGFTMLRNPAARRMLAAPHSVATRRITSAASLVSIRVRLVPPVML